jgi:hypothetical protein
MLPIDAPILLYIKQLDMSKKAYMFADYGPGRSDLPFASTDGLRMPPGQWFE